MCIGRNIPSIIEAQCWLALSRIIADVKIFFFYGYLLSLLYAGQCIRVKDQRVSRSPV